MDEAELQILILSNDEKVLGSLNPDYVDITEINDYSTLKELKLSHPINDNGVYDYDTLLKHGNKIWKSKTEDGDSCLYVINAEKYKDIDTITLTAEEALTELNNIDVVENSTSTPITINSTILNTWFGDLFTIGTFEAPILKTTTTFTGTLTRMALLRLIESDTGNIFVTRYEKDANSNVIHKYLDFKQSIGVTHITPLEIGENTEKIDITTNEDDTYSAIAPIIKGNDASSGAVDDTVNTAKVLSDFKAMAITVGQSIPMIITKNQDGTETVTANWNAPFAKDAGTYRVYLPSSTAEYTVIHKKEGSANTFKKTGTVETSETNKYMIYNACALKLMDKKDPVVTIEADVHDLRTLPGGDINYNVGDIISIRLPGSSALITTKVTKTEKDPRKLGTSKVTMGNAVSGGTVSNTDINRPAGIDTLTLSSIYSAIALKVDLVTSNNNLANKIKYVSTAVANVTAGQVGSINVTIADNPAIQHMICITAGGNQGTAQVSSVAGTVYTIQYKFDATGTNRPIYIIYFT